MQLQVGFFENSFSDSSLLVYRNATNISVLILYRNVTNISVLTLYPATLLNSFRKIVARFWGFVFFFESLTVSIYNMALQTVIVPLFLSRQLSFQLIALRLVFLRQHSGGL